MCTISLLKGINQGSGRKEFPKLYNIDTVKAIIKKWRNLDITVTGRPPKIDERPKKGIREAGKRPMATLKEAQICLESTGHSLHATTIFYSSCLGNE